MKILAFGDSVKLPTGYGRVNVNVLGYFALLGHEVVQIAGGHTEPPEPVAFRNGTSNQQAIVTILPSGSGDYHSWSGIAEQYIRQWQPDLVHNSNDFFTSEDIVTKDLKMFF